MSKSESQIDFVRRQLKSQGKVSRNQCLRHYISRLSAIIFLLKSEGMEIEGEFVEANTPFGKHKDFVYYWKNQDIEIHTIFEFKWIDSDNEEGVVSVPAETFQKACSIFLNQIPIFLFAIEEEVVDSFAGVHYVESDERFKDFRTYSKPKKRSK